jgi:hypothetical protein
MATALVTQTQTQPGPLIGMDEQFPEFHNRVRFDQQTKKASVLDVITVMTGQKSKHCSMVLARLSNTYPELYESFETIRIDGKVGYTLYFLKVKTTVKHMCNVSPLIFKLTTTHVSPFKS